MKTSQDLNQLLRSIDHKGYPAYKSTKGAYSFGDYTLSIDHVQGDPFASPSKVSIHIAGKANRIPDPLFNESHRRIALQDHLLRGFSRAIQPYSFKAQGSGKSGLISVSSCGQEILERTACQLNPKTGDLTVHLEIGFPARGRTVQSQELIKILFDFLPDCIHRSFYYAKLNPKTLQDVADLADDQNYIRTQLPQMGLTAFVANGAILPRESGVSQRPMKHAVAFQSPKSMEVTMTLPHSGTISGMGVPCGIILIVGGGYHGKSTLLKALELGVYPHIKGDGREFVITEDSAVKIRSEDGRSIRNTDISLFIKDLPNKKDTSSFVTEDASGSTSQAANIIESMESGTKTFLIDEDTSATNFMIRDELMQRVIHRNQEPITPFIERVQYLYKEYGISSVIVAGSSGSYFQIADHIVQMDHYQPVEITERAKEEAKAFPSVELPAKPEDTPDYRRIFRISRSLARQDRIKLKVHGKDNFQIQKDTVDLRYVEQLADYEQTAALACCLQYIETKLFDGRITLTQAIELLIKEIRQKNLDVLANATGHSGMNLAMPRKQEIFACMNRYRML